MADFFNILKGLFVREIEVPDENEQAGGQTRAEAEEEVVEDQREVSSEAPEGEAGEDLVEKFRNIFMQTLDEYNREGFDYLEFRHSLKSMRNITKDEATCFRSIFATAKTLGASKESLVESVDYYQKVLRKEEQKFSNALEKQKEKRQETLDQRLDQIQETIAQKLDTIRTLQEEVEEHKSEAKHLRRMIARSNQRIADTRRAFNQTYDEFVEQLDSDKEKLKEYLDAN